MIWSAIKKKRAENDDDSKSESGYDSESIISKAMQKEISQGDLNAENQSQPSEPPEKKI